MKLHPVAVMHKSDPEINFVGLRHFIGEITTRDVSSGLLRNAMEAQGFVHPLKVTVGGLIKLHELIGCGDVEPTARWTGYVMLEDAASHVMILCEDARDAVLFALLV